jgi:hypothetical protein
MHVQAHSYCQRRFSGRQQGRQGGYRTRNPARGQGHRVQRREKAPVRFDRHGLARPPRLSKLIMGSVTQKVLAYTKLPVLVFR